MIQLPISQFENLDCNPGSLLILVYTSFFKDEVTHEVDLVDEHPDRIKVHEQLGPDQGLVTDHLQADRTRRGTGCGRVVVPTHRTGYLNPAIHSCNNEKKKKPSRFTLTVFFNACYIYDLRVTRKYALPKFNCAISPKLYEETRHSNLSDTEAPKIPTFQGSKNSDTILG